MPPDIFKQRLRETIRQIRAAPKTKGAERIYLPGEMEWERREKALVEGIELPDDVVTSLQTLAEELGMVALSR